MLRLWSRDTAADAATLKLTLPASSCCVFDAVVQEGSIVSRAIALPRALLFFFVKPSRRAHVHGVPLPPVFSERACLSQARTQPKAGRTLCSGCSVVRLMYSLPT